MYEMDALQARIAYNWRDKFLDTTSQYVNEPGYTEAYSQIDFSMSYEVSDALTVSFEGINITDENIGARYALGTRYTF